MAPPWFTPPKAPTGPRQATVIGAGLGGVSIACHLHQRGWQITLIDKNELFAMGTSGHPAGLIKPQVNTDNITISLYYKNYFQYFTEYLKNLLELFPDIQHGYKNLSEAINLDPKLTLAKPCSWLSPIDFCRAQLALHPNITTLYNTEVTQLRNDRGCWQSISSDGKTLSDTAVCVLSGGYEINFLLGKNRLSIEPLAGQISVLSEAAITPAVTTACYGRHYLIPLNDKRYVCGASHHRDAALDVNQTDHEENLRGLEHLLPNHRIDKTQLIGGRTGVRTVSPDHLPIIGGLYDKEYYRSEYEDLHHGKKSTLYPPAKYKKGLFVFGALGSHGISNSPYLGKLLSAIIDGSVSNTDQATLELLHPARFLIRDLKRKPADRKMHY